MFKSSLINSNLCRVLATMGHTDTITLSDCGLPIPRHCECIDLAVTKGTPSLMTILKNTVAVMQIEKVTLAEEISTQNKKLQQEILTLLASVEKQQQRQIELEYMPHTQFKLFTASSKAIVRSGEASPYANIILHSGVIF